MNFARLNMSRLNFDVVRKVVRKNLSDGESLYRKVVENLIINSTSEKSSKMKLWIERYGISKITYVIELAQSACIN
jgi:hypothetical protein